MGSRGTYSRIDTHVHLDQVSFEQDVAAAMNSGLLMSSTYKAARHATLHKVVTTHTSHTWAALLVKMLLSQINGQTTARGTPYLPKELLKDKYDSASKRLFLFDYDVRTIHLLWL